jgi:hypothetical protein
MTPAELKAWRMARGLSQKEVARRLAIGERTYQGYEAGFNTGTGTPGRGGVRVPVRIDHSKVRRLVEYAVIGLGLVLDREAATTSTIARSTA